MNRTAPVFLDHLASLADTTRARILLLLERHELTVSELCTIMQLPQSTVSRHLKALADAGWVSSRAEGTSNAYTMVRADMDASARRLWLLVREQMDTAPTSAQDQRRLHSALAARRTRSQEFFASSAGQWDRLRDELFGDRFHLLALGAFAQADWVVGDLGCGTGPLSAALSPFVRRVVAVDGSATMLQAARKRLQGLDNIDLRRGELEALPIDDARLDAATLMLVLHHIAEPTKALSEAARVLRPGGLLVLVDMLPHDREHYRQAMGHVWLGFPERQVREFLTDAAFDDIRIVALPADPKAKGPALFVATARNARATKTRSHEAS
jgi:ArsR family transcriptional regulator